MSDNITLNSGETESAAGNLDNYKSDIEKSLSDMSDIMTKISSLLEGELSGAIFNKFSEFENQFPTINTNMQSYVNDFKNLVVSFAEQDSSVAAQDVSTAQKGGELVNVNY